MLALEDRKRRPGPGSALQSRQESDAGLTLTPLDHRGHSGSDFCVEGALTSPGGWDGRHVSHGSCLCWEEVGPAPEARVPDSRPRSAGSGSHAARARARACPR